MNKSRQLEEKGSIVRCKGIGRKVLVSCDASIACASVKCLPNALLENFRNMTAIFSEETSNQLLFSSSTFPN